MYTTNKSTKSIADAALKVMMGEAKSPAQQAAIEIAMKEKGQKPKDEMKEAKLHPNQQVLDVHEPEKDELTAKDFEMLRKGKKAPTAIKEEDAYSKDRYAVKNGKAIKDNPSHMGSANYKDQPHHVWATSAEEALKKKKVTEGTIAGDILKKIDEMKGPWPGTPEYNKRFPKPEMKPGEEKATKTGVIKKTIKGIVHTAKTMKEEVEVQQQEQEEVKVLAKEEVSFQNLINLYMDNGVESLLKTVEKIKEEASNDEFHKEVEENKKKAEGKVEQPEVAKGAVKAVAVTKEEVEQIDELKKETLKSYVSKATDSSRTMPGYGTKAEKSKKTMRHTGISRAIEKLAKEEVEQVDEAAKWRSTSVAKKVTNPDDPQDSVAHDYHYDNPRSTGMKKATSDTPTKYGSLSARPNAQVASQGARKGMITKQHAERLKARIKAGMNNEEVEQVDEASYSAKAARAGEDIGKPGKMFSKIAASAAKRYGSEERGKKVADALLAKLRKEEIEELTDDQIEMIFEQIDAQLNERSMTEPEMKKREDIVKGMKKNLAGFKERYGERAKSVMYATATARAKGE